MTHIIHLITIFFITIFQVVINDKTLHKINVTMLGVYGLTSFTSINEVLKTILLLGSIIFTVIRTWKAYHEGKLAKNKKSKP